MISALRALADVVAWGEPWAYEEDDDEETED